MFTEKTLNQIQKRLFDYHVKFLTVLEKKFPDEARKSPAMQLISSALSRTQEAIKLAGEIKKSLKEDDDKADFLSLKLDSSLNKIDDLLWSLEDKSDLLAISLLIQDTEKESGVAFDSLLKTDNWLKAITKEVFSSSPIKKLGKELLKSSLHAFFGPFAHIGYETSEHIVEGYSLAKKGIKLAKGVIFKSKEKPFGKKEKVFSEGYGVERVGSPSVVTTPVFSTVPIRKQEESFGEYGVERVGSPSVVTGTENEKERIFSSAIPPSVSFEREIAKGQARATSPSFYPGRSYTTSIPIGSAISSGTSQSSLLSSLVNFFSKEAYSASWTKEMLKSVQGFKELLEEKGDDKKGFLDSLKDSISRLFTKLIPGGAMLPFVPKIAAGAAGIGMGIWDVISALKSGKPKEWLGGEGIKEKVATSIGSFFGGTGKGIGEKGATFGDVAKNIGWGAFKGATIGSIIPVVGTGLGAAIGAGLSAIGGERIAKVENFMGTLEEKGARLFTRESKSPLPVETVSPIEKNYREEVPKIEVRKTESVPLAFNPLPPIEDIKEKMTVLLPEVIDRGRQLTDGLLRNILEAINVMSKSNKGFGSMPISKPDVADVFGNKDTILNVMNLGALTYQ